jgi:hypothetical protein
MLKCRIQRRPVTLMEIDADLDHVLRTGLAFIADNGKEDRGTAANVPGLLWETKLCGATWVYITTSFVRGPITSDPSTTSRRLNGFETLLTELNDVREVVIGALLYGRPFRFRQTQRAPFVDRGKSLRWYSIRHRRLHARYYRSWNIMA